MTGSFDVFILSKFSSNDSVLGIRKLGGLHDYEIMPPVNLMNHISLHKFHRRSCGAGRRVRVEIGDFSGSEVQNENTIMDDQENEELQSGTPQAFLNSVVGQPVWVRLNSGIDYKGSFPSRPT
jgi:hypothetical protein